MLRKDLSPLATCVSSYQSRKEPLMVWQSMGVSSHTILFLKTTKPFFCVIIYLFAGTYVSQQN